LVDFVSE
jgi:ribonuclease HI